MKPILISLGICLFSSLAITPNLAAKEYTYEKLGPPRSLTEEQAKVAEANYKKYCTLCHGEDRQGHVNDHAPSLKSRSLFESGVPHAILRPLSYGREGTAMAGYLDEVGGPLTLEETWNLTYWLFEQSGVDRVKLSTKPVVGDVKAGEITYQKECSTSALAHNTDEVIRYAIRHGRQDTPMPAFADKLSEQEIDDVTAFLRSKASGWTDKKKVLRRMPTPDEYVINPKGENPNFELQDDLYVSAKDLNAALTAKRKMVLLDTRVPSVWQTAHIEGSVPLPYYADLDETVKDLPKDVQIVAYCSCPRAAADHVVKKLRKRGFDNTAVLYEGIFGWMHQGFPVSRRELEDK